MSAIASTVPTVEASPAQNINQDMSPGDLTALLNGQREAIAADPCPSISARIDRIDRCIDMIVTHQDSICEAVEKDFGCRSKYVTRLTDLFISLQNLKFVKKNLKKWMKVERRKAIFPTNLLGGRSEIHYQPKGVVGIMTPWNVPVNMIFSPLADILGAGNRAMIKPSEFTPNTAALMQQLFAEYFSADEIVVVTGGVATGAAFSRLPLDHIIFTGAGHIGKMVMQAAAENLTPVTLELGGKSPVIISNSCKLEDAAEKIMAAKTMNGGQVCISPDYCFVPAAKLETFVDHCKQIVARTFPSFQDNPDFVSLINEANYDRVKSYLDDAVSKGAEVISLDATQATWDDRSKHKIPLHLVINPTDDMLVMQEELFGPILCVRSYDSLDYCINDINNRPNPLALYYFGNDKAEQDKIVKQTLAGAMTVNDIAMHFACDDLPFGGVGASGMGHYHGREGFKTFSHAKSVFKQGVLNLPKLAGLLPPYGDKIDKLSSRLVKK